jgi:AraC-like DNA-binding protein
LPRLDRDAVSTITAILAAKLVGSAARRGLDPNPLFGLLGLRSPAEATLERRVPIETYYELWAQVTRSLRDASLPVTLAESVRIEDFGVFGFALMTAASGREALSRTVRYVRLITDSGHWELMEGRRSARLRWCREGQRTLGHRLANESAIAELVHGMRQVVGAEFSPIVVTFRHRAPAEIAAHRRFFGCPIAFGADADGFEFDRSVLESVPRAANPAMGAYLDQQVASLLGRVPSDDDLVGRARQAIATALASGVPSSTRIAKNLGLSDRGFRRRLEERNTSFRALVADVRKTRADELLKSSRVTVGEVAFLLGFAGVDSFSRAFKRWSGASPSEFRARAGTGDARA